MDRIEGDIEFFEVRPDGTDGADDDLDVVDSSRPRQPRVRRRAAALAAGLAVLALLVASIVAHRANRPDADSLATATLSPAAIAEGSAIAESPAAVAERPAAVAEGPRPLPSWIDVFGPAPFGLSESMVPIAADHCPAHSVSMSMADTTHLVATIAEHLSGFVVDQATRIINQQGALCTAYLQAHNDGGVVLWLVATAESTASAASIVQLDYGPAALQVHSVTVVTPDRSTVSVLAQGPDPSLPASGELTRLASDPALRS